MEKIKLTSFSHGAGCGCKIAPKVLDEILKSETDQVKDPALLIGNDTRDDAAVYALDDERAVISTTDFFMPIVDDPFEFGGIASVNAISDVYAMGGKPLMAISILGWPVDKIPAGVAARVVDGARDACRRAGIPLAGGHSIDSPEPIFGLAVTGIVERNKIKSNNRATEGCDLYLTKPLGIGILTTAQKKGILSDEDRRKVTGLMLALNDIGYEFGNLDAVKAMTDVTGFGLLGHLREICEGSGLSAEVDFEKIPLLPGLKKYLDQGSIPGGTHRNFSSYGDRVSPMTDEQKLILCDPQTSGGLLVAVDPEGKNGFLSIMEEKGLPVVPCGKLISSREKLIFVN